MDGSVARDVMSNRRNVELDIRKKDRGDLQVDFYAMTWIYLPPVALTSRVAVRVHKVASTFEGIQRDTQQRTKSRGCTGYLHNKQAGTQLT